MSEWISMKERKPDTDRVVLIIGTMRLIDLGRYQEGVGAFYSLVTDGYIDFISHWAELPPLPDEFRSVLHNT